MTDNDNQNKTQVDKDLKATRIGFKSASPQTNQEPPGEQTESIEEKEEQQEDATSETNLEVEDNEVRDEEGTVWAKANPSTNTLWVRVPEENEQQIAIAAAMVAIEEFLHGEWIVAIMYQLAHLEHAANQALDQYITGDTDLDDHEPLQIIVACQQTIQQIMGDIESYVEAVDKFQHHHTINSDDDYIDSTVAEFEERNDSREVKEFKRQLEDRIESDWQRAAGTDEASEDTSYVDPVYFRALFHIVKRWEKDEEKTEDSEHGRGRTIAEAVARATLDIPQPIAPLGGEQFPEFEALSPMEEGPEPIDYEELTNPDRYSVTEDEFEWFRSHLVEGDRRDEGAENDDMLPTNEWESLTYEKLQESWVLRAFVNVCNELRKLKNEDDPTVDLTDPDVEDLRERLAAVVHGVDSDDHTETMQDCATALLDYPRQQVSRSEEEGDNAQFTYPLETIYEKSFDSHGMFGVVIYHPEKDETETSPSDNAPTDHLLNWHINDEIHEYDGIMTEPEGDTNGTKESTPDLDNYPHVPDGQDSYKAYWEFHWFWNHIRYHILDAYQTYRSSLEDDITEELTQAELREKLQSASESITKGINDTTTAFEHHTHLKAHRKNIKVEQRPAGVIKQAAASVGIDVSPDSVEYESVDCPLCDIRRISCGGDGNCIKDKQCSAIEEEIPEIVSQLATAELQYLQS